jgi:hypothetical protein
MLFVDEQKQYLFKSIKCKKLQPVQYSYSQHIITLQQLK